MSEITGVIFDCDGVLVDSHEANIATYQNLLRVAGYDKPSPEQVRACFHLPLIEGIVQITGINDQAELNRIVGLIEDPKIRAPHLFEFPQGLHTTLTTLRNEKYELGIVTSRIRSGLDDVLDAGDIRNFFDTLVVKEEYDKPKPNPEGLLLALRRMKKRSQEAVYIGDSHVDVLAAKAAGMFSIHLARTKHDDADIGITDFKQIPEAVRSL